MRVRSTDNHRHRWRATLALLLWLPAMAVLADYSEAYNAAVRQQWDLAAAEFKVLAEQGDPRAQTFLATLYRRGLGVSRDPAQAVYWYERAAAQDDVGALYNLAVHNRKGLGTAHNEVRATELFERAARLGMVEAQINVGLRLLDGLGAERDPVRGLAWLQKAAWTGNTEATRRRDYYARSMSSEEREAAKALARQL